MSTTLGSSSTTSSSTAATTSQSSSINTIPAMISPCEDLESFKKFFECWLVEQHQYLEQLSAYATTSRYDAEALKQLISQVMDHYKHYYNTKSKWAQLNVLDILTPSWRSSLEEAFLWIGGWLPSTAFHLLYSKSGLQLEQRLSEILRGLATNHDLGDLSSSQLSRVDQLQRSVTEERKVTELMAKHQESMADPSMVELSHLVTESMKNNGGDGGTVGLQAEEEERVETALRLKEEVLEELLQRADDLRLTTLKDIVDILTPIQAVHFLIAAAELHLRVHDWGRTRDELK